MSPIRPPARRTAGAAFLEVPDAYDLLDDVDDLLDPTTAEGITFIVGSGFLDDDQDDADGAPCTCWCGCRRPTCRTTSSTSPP